MFNTHLSHSRRGRPIIVVGLATLAVALAACSSASPSQSAAVSESAAPSASVAAARCAFTPDGSASVTIQIASVAFGDDVTVSAGQAVDFTNQDGAGHTITEGTGGEAAADACVDESIAGGATVIVIFNEPGDFQITCKIHASMQTAVHVE